MDVMEKTSNEKRLIDADRRTIATALKMIHDADFTPGVYEHSVYGKAALILEKDAVEVVRCRECKYWGDEDGKLQRSDGVLFARCKIHNYLLDGRHTGWCPTENDFCSYGERKEGADNG